MHVVEFFFVDCEQEVILKENEKKRKETSKENERKRQCFKNFVKETIV